MYVCDMMVQRELEDKRKQDNVSFNKATFDTTITTLLKKKGKNACKWKVEKLCDFLKHPKIPGNQRVPMLWVNLLA